MKKKLLVLTFLIISRSALCDVIFFPYPFTGLSYSAELIASYESFKKSKNTTTIWGGIGHVGSMVYPEMKSFGVELAIEWRHYFKPDQFRHTFISAYIGGAHMTDFDSFSTIGLVPGVKINYKANLARSFVLEPYMSFSLPISRELTVYKDTIAFPALTFGARLGLNKLNDKRQKT